MLSGGMPVSMKLENSMYVWTPRHASPAASPQPQARPRGAPLPQSLAAPSPETHVQCNSAWLPSWPSKLPRVNVTVLPRLCCGRRLRHVICVQLPVIVSSPRRASSAARPARPAPCCAERRSA